jgi:hypothetical protein
MSVRRDAVEDFVLEADGELYAVVFAVRVGALDGRIPESERAGLATHRNGDHR